MGTPEQWLQILATVKGLATAIKSGADLLTTIEKYRQDNETVQESRRVSASYSTYTGAEVAAIAARLNGCVQRFIDQGGGADRARCVCSVLREAKEGNGGTLPRIDDWENIYRDLGCSRFEAAAAK